MNLFRSWTRVLAASRINSWFTSRSSSTSMMHWKKWITRPKTLSLDSNNWLVITWLNWKENDLGWLKDDSNWLRLIQYVPIPLQLHRRETKLSLMDTGNERIEILTMLVIKLMLRTRAFMCLATTLSLALLIPTVSPPEEVAKVLNNLRYPCYTLFIL